MSIGDTSKPIRVRVDFLKMGNYFGNFCICTTLFVLICKKVKLKYLDCQ